MLALTLLSGAAAAQTCKDPRLGDGFEMNNPANGPGKQRQVTGLELANETPLQAASRVIQGAPRIELTTVGAEISNASTKEKLEVALRRDDGPDVCELGIPIRFLSGWYTIGLGNLRGDPAPLLATSFRLDVPTLLAMSSKLSIDRMKVSFFRYDASIGEWEMLVVDLVFEPHLDRVVVKY